MTPQVLSLGAGVQSSVLLLMSCRGELPPLDLAIFADTQWEPRAVYEHLAWLEKEAAAAGIPVVTVTRGTLRADALAFREHRTGTPAELPLFVHNGVGKRPGRIRRQCTSRFKVEPIEQYLRREVMGLAPRQRAPKTVQLDQWRGITTDEAWRMKDSRHAWMRVVYPFCGVPATAAATPAPMNRHDCRMWFDARYPGRALPRSSCLGCPNRTDAGWRMMRVEAPSDWADAVAFDKAIRIADRAGQAKRGLSVGLPYVHRSCKPLDEVPLSAAVNQQEFAFGDECEGYCGT